MHKILKALYKTYKEKPHKLVAPRKKFTKRDPFISHKNSLNFTSEQTNLEHPIFLLRLM